MGKRYGEDRLMGKRYLKQINILPEASKGIYEEKVRQLADRLAQEGVAVWIVTDKADVPVRHRAAGTLWLTDSDLTAEKLTAAQLPVIAWLHEENRQSSFENIRYAVEEPQELDADFYDRIYRRYAGIPWDIAETHRCLIRETTSEDAEDFLEIYEEPSITRYTDSFCTEVHMEREYVKEYIEKVYDFYGYGIWTVVWKETGEVIGRVGFGQEEVPNLGYMVALPWQGRGIAQEVCRAALAFAGEELGFEQVQAVIHKDNLVSIKVAEKLGFKRFTQSMETDSEHIRFILRL